MSDRLPTTQDIAGALAQGGAQLKAGLALLEPLALKAWAVLTALLIVWGIVAAYLLFHRSSAEADAARIEAALKQTNAFWKAQVDDARRARPAIEMRVVTNEIRVSQFTGALDALRSNYAGASNRHAALLIYNAHSN